MFLEEGLEVRTPDLLFAFDEEDEVHRQIARALQGLLHTADMGKDLALVVGGAARKHDVPGDPRFERRRLPQLHGIHRLHIVMSVDEHGPPAGLVPIACHDDGVPSVGCSSASRPIPASFAVSQRPHSATAPRCSGLVEMLGKRSSCRNSSTAVGFIPPRIGAAVRVLNPAACTRHRGFPALLPAISRGRGYIPAPFYVPHYDLQQPANGTRRTDRHPCRLGQLPTRPRRRHLHRPARSRGHDAGRVPARRACRGC